MRRCSEFYRFNTGTQPHASLLVSTKPGSEIIGTLRHPSLSLRATLRHAATLSSEYEIRAYHCRKEEDCLISQSPRHGCALKIRSRCRQQATLLSPPSDGNLDVITRCAELTVNRIIIDSNFLGRRGAFGILSFSLGNKSKKKQEKRKSDRARLPSEVLLPFFRPAIALSRGAIQIQKKNTIPRFRLPVSSQSRMTRG